MPFPMDAYAAVMGEARSIVEERDLTGRNDVIPLLDKFIHGHQDVIYEIHERVCRIRGAEKTGNLIKMREDAIDLVNEAAFLVMLLERTSAAARAASAVRASAPA